jgi:AraC-like DNA-binding protein
MLTPSGSNGTSTSRSVDIDIAIADNICAAARIRAASCARRAPNMTGKVPRVEMELAEQIGHVNDLKACVGNLASVFAIPSTSSGCDSRQVIAASLDVLLGMLRLEFAYASFVDAMNGTPTVLVRTRQSGKAAHVRHYIAPVIASSLPDGPPKPVVVVSATRGGDISIARLQLGLDDEIGVILAGSRRKDFPTEIERLLLCVAVNQVAIRLREARLLGEQKLITWELDQKVAQQAVALETANRELEQARARIELLRDDRDACSDAAHNGPAVTRGGLAPWQLQRARELMTGDLQEPVPLSRLAEQCGLSTHHFARAFRQSTGVPPHRWLLRHRVGCARKLLRNPALSLAEIALACGFADQSHFTRVFTSVVRLSPGLWRRMQSQKPAGSTSTDRSASSANDGRHQIADAKSSRYLSMPPN